MINIQERNLGIYFLLSKTRNYAFIYYSKNVDDQYEIIKRKLDNGEWKANKLQQYWNQDLEQSFVFVKQYMKDEDKLRSRVEKWVDYFRKNNFEVEHLLNKVLVKKEWEIDRDRQRKSEQLWEVDVDLKQEIYEIKGQLDYSLEFSEDRVKLVNEIFKSNEQWMRQYISSKGFIDKQVKTKNHVLTEKDMYGIFMTSVVDYLRFPNYKNQEFKDFKIKYDDYIMTNYKNDINEIRELLVADITDIDERHIVKTDTKIRKRQDNYKLVPKQEINERDRKEFIELDRYQTFAEFVDKEIKKTPHDLKRLRKLRAIRKELANDLILAKDRIRGTIYFKRLSGDTTGFSLDCDTGYFDDRIVKGKWQYGDYKLVSKNKIELNNPKHVFAIIDNYSSLREACYETPDSDLWLLLHDFDNLVENTKFEEYVKDILIMKIDGLSGKIICNEIKHKYGIELTTRNLTKIYKNTIPNMISDTYINQYEEWFYTYKAYGKYKTCSKCGEVKLASVKHFSPDKRNADNFHSICKSCR